MCDSLIDYFFPDPVQRATILNASSGVPTRLSAPDVSTIDIQAANKAAAVEAQGEQDADDLSSEDEEEEENGSVMDETEVKPLVRRTKATETKSSRKVGSFRRRNSDSSTAGASTSASASAGASRQVSKNIFSTTLRSSGISGFSSTNYQGIRGVPQTRKSGNIDKYIEDKNLQVATISRPTMSRTKSKKTRNSKTVAPVEHVLLVSKEKT